MNRRSLVRVEGRRTAGEREDRLVGAIRARSGPLLTIVLATLLAACGATVQHVDEAPATNVRPSDRTTLAPAASGPIVSHPPTPTHGASATTTRVEVSPRTTLPTRTTTTPAARPAPATAPHPVPRPTGEVAASLAQLGTLAVKGRAPKTGYDRDLFGPAWTDDVDVAGGHNGCDTRNDILRRDLKDITFKAGTRDCVVLTGTLLDPYTGKIIAFQRGAGTSTAVQIEHVVALLDAWQKGAQQLSVEQRRNLANDPIELLAVDGPTNAAKGAGDAATWLPPNKRFRCRYVALQVAVKVRYRLWVTQAEHDAIARILDGCSDAQVRDGR